MDPNDERLRTSWFSRLVPASRRRVLSALTGVANIVVGASLFVQTDFTLLKVAAIGILLLGATHSVELAAGAARRHRNDEELDQDLFDHSIRIKRKRRDPHLKRSARRILSKVAERHASTVHEAKQSAEDPLAWHAFFFYVGLIVGVLGTAVTVSGLIANTYPSTLAGSIVASLGFVTLACALISAENASKAA